MAVNLSPVGGVAAQFFTNTGAVLTGGKLYTYLAGTTTPATTYTTSQGNVAWTNPIVLDAAGRVSGSGEIWLTDGIIYKFVLKDSNDVLIATYDNITGINSNSVAYTNQQEIQTATAGQTVFNLATMSFQPGTNSLSVFVDGVNQYGPGAQYAYTETDADTVTFASGLHVGAEVKFTTTQQQGAGAVDASQVSYNPPFSGGAATNVEAKLSEYVSVNDFGASPSASSAVNQTAFEAALSASNSVYIPEGNYNITGPLYINGTGKKVYGAGMSASKLTITGGGLGIVIGNSGSTSATNHDIVFSDVWISGGTYALQVGSVNSPLTFIGEVSRVKLTDATAGGLYLYQAIASFNDMAINSNYRGIVTLVAGGDPTASMFNRCRIYQNTNEGWYCETAWNFQLNECNFESNGKEGVKFVKNDGTVITNVTFNSCWFESNLTDGTLSSANVLMTATGSTLPSNITFYDCEFNTVTGSGSGNIHIKGGSDPITLTGNRYVTPSSSCVNISSANSFGFATDNSAVFVSSSRINVLSGNLQLTSAAASVGGGSANFVSLGSTTATTVGAAGGASALPATPLGYLIAYVGTTQVKIPYYST